MFHAERQSGSRGRECCFGLTQQRRRVRRTPGSAQAVTAPVGRRYSRAPTCAMRDNRRQVVTAASTNQQHSHEGVRELPTLPLPAQTSHHGEPRRDGPRGRLRTAPVRRSRRSGPNRYSRKAATGPRGRKMLAGSAWTRPRQAALTAPRSRLEASLLAAASLSEWNELGGLARRRRRLRRHARDRSRLSPKCRAAGVGGCWYQCRW